MHEPDSESRSLCCRAPVCCSMQCQSALLHWQHGSFNDSVHGVTQAQKIFTHERPCKCFWSESLLRPTLNSQYDYINTLSPCKSWLSIKTKRNRRMLWCVLCTQCNVSTASPTGFCGGDLECLSVACLREGLFLSLLQLSGQWGQAETCLCTYCAL